MGALEFFSVLFDLFTAMGRIDGGKWVDRMGIDVGHRSDLTPD